MSQSMLTSQLPESGLLIPVTVNFQSDSVAEFQSYLPAQAVQHSQAVVLAQFEDVDVLGDLANLWNTFVSSGQIWALLIGLVFGYLIRGLTSY